MKIYSDYKRGMNIDKYYSHGFIVHSKEFSCFNDDNFSIEEVIAISKDISSCNKNLDKILDVDRIVPEKELNSLYQYIDKVYDFYDYFLFSDLAVFSYFEEKGSLNKLIYNSKTLVASSFEASIYQEKGVKTILANELSILEIKKIANKLNSISLEVFGYHQMFYSKRNLITLFTDFLKEEKPKVDLNNKKLLINEELRNEMYPIYESEHGTFIYTDYIYFLFLELKELCDKIDFIIINGIFLNEDIYQKVVNIYFEYINSSFDEKYYEKLLELKLNLSRGFLDNQSVLLKVNENES